MSNGHRRCTDGWVFPAGAINVAALAAATEQMTAPIAAATSKAESKAYPDDAITGPIRAVATNPPVRATALFSPDAAPVWWLSTDINTAVVSPAPTSHCARSKSAAEQPGFAVDHELLRTVSLRRTRRPTGNAWSSRNHSG